MFNAAMIRQWGMWGLLVTVAGAFGLAVGFAGDRDDKTARASELVAEALHRQIYGISKRK